MELYGQGNIIIIIIVIDLLHVKEIQIGIE